MNRILISSILLLLSFSIGAKTLTHSVDDYRRRIPLSQALKLGFQSVEADIYFRKREVRVGSTMLTTIGTLKELYLDPIQEFIKKNGFIGEKGKTFYLWLDIQSDYRKLPLAVLNTLKEYDFLTTQNQGKLVKKGQVTVIISGRKAFKDKFFKLSKEVPALKEGANIDDKLESWLSIDWLSITNWNGIKDIDKKLRLQINETIEKAHKMGKKIRFKNVPENEVIWSELISANVDMIGAQNLKKLSTFLKNKNL